MAKQERNIRFLAAVVRWLRQLREERGLSQERVEFKTGIYTGYVEQGLRNISITALIDVCEVYGVTVEEFFTGMESYEEEAL